MAKRKKRAASANAQASIEARAQLPSSGATRCHRLDWNEISTTRQNFVDTVYLLSMLDEQQRADNDEDYSDDMSAENNSDWNDEEDDFDYTIQSLHEEIGAKDKSVASTTLAGLKNHFLDRLSELLARKKGSSTDGKEVSCAYMMEHIVQRGPSRAQVRVAKNEGLSGNLEEYRSSGKPDQRGFEGASDMKFLGNLSRQIKMVAHKGLVSSDFVLGLNQI